MKRRHLVLLALVVGACVLSKLTHRARRADQAIDDALTSAQRFVDAGLVLKVVEKDDRGEELILGGPRLAVLREHVFGGVFDTLLRCWVGPSRNPVIQYCSRDQEPLILHDDSMPEGIWMQGGMGAGKSTGGGLWFTVRTIKHATHALRGAGVTAPTEKRMEEVLNTLMGPSTRQGRLGGIWRRSWFTWREGAKSAVMFSGLPVAFRTAHVQSAEAGSPFQGQNWAFSLNDELQDYYRLDEDIQMRGRSAWRGRYERFATCTPKDDPGYRDFRSKVETSQNWHVARVVGPDQPWQSDVYWQRRIAELPPRAAQRKIWALDVGPERAVYPTWARKTLDGKPGNLRPIPELHAEDVTAEVLREYGHNYHVLVGHDPGKREDTSVLLKAYRLPRLSRHVWFVVGEVVTPATTTEQHVVKLLEVLRSDAFRCDQPPGRSGEVTRRALVRADPYSDSAQKSRNATKSVYDVFRAAGLHIRPAAYSQARPDKPGTVLQDDRIDMVTRLLCDAHGERRLFVACDDRGQPVAPKVVESFERSEKNAAYEAEREKGEGDVSHPAAAIGYALWMLEKPRVAAAGAGA